MKTARAMAIVIAPLTALVLAGGCSAVPRPRLPAGPVSRVGPAGPVRPAWSGPSRTAACGCR